jgi:hypothetical protein
MKLGVLRNTYDPATLAQLGVPHISRLHTPDMDRRSVAVRVPAPQDATLYDRLRHDPEIRARLASVPRLVRPIPVRATPLAERLRELL